MDQDRYPSPKRRRTSDADSSSSRNSSRAPRSHPPPLRHSEATRSGQDSRRRREYSSSRSRGPSRDGTPRRRRSRSQSSSRRRSSRSPTGSSAYDSAPEQQDEHIRSRTRRHSGSRSGSSAYSPPLGRSPSPSHSRSASRHAKSSPLKFTPLSTIPRAHARGITSLKFSPDMTLLATASADNAINIYSVPPNPTPDTPFKHLRTLRAHLAGVNAIAWSPIGPNYTLVSASDDKSILLWSPLSSDFPISPSPLIGHSNYVYSLAFSPKGNMLVSGSYDEAVFLWDVRAGRVMRSLPAHSDPVGGVDFLRDGTMVCSCAGDGLIRIWDAGTGQCLKTLVDEDRRPVTSVRFTPNGKYVLAWTLDSSIRLWRYTEGTCVKTYQGHVNQKYSLGGVVGSYSSTHATQAFVASGSEDGDVLVWDITSKEVLWRGRGHSDVVLGVDFGRTKSGKGLLVSGGRDRDVRLWLLEGANEDKRDATGAADTDMDPNMTADMMDVDGMPDGGEHVHGRDMVGNGMDVDMDTPRRENS